jgi:rhamnosyltransferase
VISAFKPTEGLLTACRSALHQVQAVLVVDDGSGPSADEVLASCAQLGVEVHRHADNRGVAAALNTGIEAARRPGSPADPRFVLTMDQDSALPPGYVDRLVAAADAARSAGAEVGLVGPERVAGIGSMVARHQGALVLGREPVQSGLLIPARVLDALGPLDEGLFIDGVDSELYLRVRAAGLAVLIAPGTHLEHQLGTSAPVPGGSRLRLTHAAAFRYYYIARNRLLLVRRYARVAPGWCVGSVVKDLRHLAITSLLVPGRRARWSAVLAGLTDGLRGVTGPRRTR